MKIFNRGTETKTAAATAATVTTAPAAPSAQAPAASPSPAQSAQGAPPANPAAPAPPANVPPAPDLAVILDANVKEMSEKIARLASTLENANQERTGFEAKIDQMEERMRKLSSLTEMISAQYNPFVGEAPSEHGELPRPDLGLAPPPVAVPPAALASLPPPPPPVAAAQDPALSLSLASLPPPDFGSLPPLDASPFAAPPPLAPSAALAPPTAVMAPPPEAAPSPAPMMAEFAAPLAFPAATPVAAPAVAPADVVGEPGVYLWQINPGFESSMLLLGWSDMLLKSAGSRESLLELVNYYHNIGWIGDPARDQVLAYADGLAAPSTRVEKDWRTDVEVHEKSLLFVEKLRAVGVRRNY